MQLIDRVAYQSSRKERLKALKNLPFEISNDSATDNAGRGGFNLQETSADIDGVMPDDIYDLNLSSEDNPDVEKAVDTLVELGDFLDSSDNEVYADFADMLLLKIAQETRKTPLDNFNDLILKINNTDMAETNDTIKKLTKIFSRTVLLETASHGDINAAYESAYKKTLNRANQYLSDGKMIKSANIYQNPRVVADYIKGVINVLVTRFAPDAQRRAYPNLRNKIMQLNPGELAGKKSPGGAAIGSAITLVKNILNGRDPHFINLVISNLVRIL